MKAEDSKTPWVLLAGGKSTRMGQPKGLLPYNGHTWLEQQLEQLQKCGQNSGVLVLGFRAAEYCAALPWLEEGLLGAELTWPPFEGEKPLRLRVVLNPTPECGPFSSVQTGLRLLGQRQHLPAVYILPIDHPAPPPAVWALFQNAFAVHPSASVILPCFHGKGGHPVLLAQSFFPLLLQCLPTSRLDVQIGLLPQGQVIRIETQEPNILLNLNTPEEWHKLKPPNERNENN